MSRDRLRQGAFAPPARAPGGHMTTPTEPPTTRPQRPTRPTFQAPTATTQPAVGTPTSATGASPTSGTPAVTGHSAPARELAEGVVVRVGEATVRLRRVRPGDGPVLTEVLLRMSQRTRWLRFHSPILRFSAAQLRSLTEVDHHDRSVLLAEVEVRPARWQPVGFAQYARIGEGRADAAIVLEDAWQRRGIGRVLALRLVEAARAAGIATFTSEVLSENRRTLDFVRALAPRTQGRLLGITTELTSWLDPP
jgi:GNAT superfamily N-acetyltransferase